VTYVRDGEGNLVKVRRPSAPAASLTLNVESQRPEGALGVATKADAAEPSVATTPTKARRVTKRRPRPEWPQPIPRVVLAVAASVAARYGISLDAILGRERFPSTVRARHEWWRLVKDTWDLSYPETARLVGGVDHTSVMSALRKREPVARQEENDTILSTKLSPKSAVGTLCFKYGF
jgi:Bacterial dnaA protein helix-turn-helix